ncbi:MAG TPA: FKBP-type peptidyl-prolyl cis-trans isomerase N-terminal domain-containing protein [Verrucomicrobiae bacterium]|jgi:FKBP-type peptidyl-prolyl cis-trans isomerase FklB
MKNTILLLALSLNVLPLLADDSMQGTNALPNERERASYAMGMYYGHYLQQRGMDSTVIDPDAVVRGLNDSISGGQTLLTPAEMSQALTDFQKDNQQVLAANRTKMQQQVAAKNLAANKTFFAENGHAAGVVTQPDGLQYKIITAGTGQLPAPADTLTVNYELTLLDGTSIQNTPQAGVPLALGSPMIPGMKEVLTNMPVGSVWDVWIPSDLAYGPSGRGPIPANSALKFHIQVIGIGSSTPAPPAPAPLTSDIIAVPSAQDIKNGAKPYTLTPEQVRQMQSQAQTNQVK